MKQNSQYQTLDGEPLKPVELCDPFLSIGFQQHSLCARCGSCYGVCPEDAISLDSERYPVLNADKCNACGLCGAVCPGPKIGYVDLAEQVFGERFADKGFDGYVEKIYVGYAGENRLREGGAGGGMATALASHLLRTGKVQGCLVTRMNREKPWQAEPFIATTIEELRMSQGSRYSIVPVNVLWSQLRGMEGKFAAILLPCQTHGFRRLQKADPELASKISIVIGLFCGGALEPCLTSEMLALRGISKDEISDFQFRGGEWPGQMRAVFDDDRPPKALHYSNYKDGAYNFYTGLYMPERCQTCLDGSNEFSDLSLSDAWTRNEDGEYKFSKHSRLLVRTQLGADLVASAVESRDIEVFDVSDDPSYKTHKMQTKRRRSLAPTRIERWRRGGRAVPEYDRTVPDDVTVKERIYEYLGSSLLRLGKWKPFRMLVMGFITSKFAVPVIELRIYLKKRKYARHQRKAEA